MRTVVIQLVGGPWDGQILSTQSPDEANACFAEALYAISGGRKGTRIPLVPPGAKKKSAKKPHLSRSAPRSHDYEISSSDQQADELVIVARHVP
jgi:hypothetical protein